MSNYCVETYHARLSDSVITDMDGDTAEELNDETLAYANELFEAAKANCPPDEYCEVWVARFRPNLPAQPVYIFTSLVH
jgi:hypothetical protein